MTLRPATSVASVLAACVLPVHSAALGAGDPPPATPAAAAPAPVAKCAPAGYPRGEEVLERFKKLAIPANADISLRSIGQTREGLPIHLFTLGPKDQDKRCPAILLVGGLDGEMLVSTDSVFCTVNEILGKKPALLDSLRIYAIPLANFDARVWAQAQGRPRTTNMRAIDDDRDGVVDEDGPSDLNGDGVIAMMRRIAPPGRTPTHLVDPVDSRIVRPAKKGGADGKPAERATHELFIEGRDLDGDGAIAEDAPTGVDLDRNFPHRWPEFTPGSGPYQLSEPESLAIAKFVRDHPDILTAIVFGRHDTLVNFPDTKDKDSTGRSPMAYLAEDHDLYRSISKLWKDTTKIERSASADLAGSLVLWLANQRGITAVAANGWARPELPKPPEGTPAPPETGDAEQAAWLAVSDTMYAGAGFRPWTPFNHPTLGPVEIGGFVPFFREAPDRVRGEEIAKAAGAFGCALAERQPALEVSAPVVRALADGLLHIDLRITNVGAAPTATTMATIADVAPPIIVRLPLKPAQVLSGRPVQKIERIEPGQSLDFAWTVRVDPSAPLEISVTGAWFDTIRRTVTTTPAASTKETSR